MGAHGSKSHHHNQFKHHYPHGHRYNGAKYYQQQQQQQSPLEQAFGNESDVGGFDRQVALGQMTSGHPPMPSRRHPPQNQRPHLNYSGSDVGRGAGISSDPFPNRTLRPILAPQSTQFDASTMQRTATRINGRFSSAYRPSSTDRVPSSAGANGTLQKQVQFLNRQQQQQQQQQQQGHNRVTFGSTSAISAREPDFPFGEASAVFTRSKDSHRASQLSINVAHRPEQDSATIDRRSANPQRAPTRASTMMRRTPGGVVNGTITRFKSDPALGDDIIDAANQRTLPRVEVDVDRFNVIDDNDLDYTSLQRPQPRHQSITAIPTETDGQRPKLRVLRPQAPVPPQRTTRVPAPGSVTELSDIVAANSADSGVEVKPELFALLNDNGPEPMPSHPTLIAPNRHHSLPRHLATRERESIRQPPMRDNSQQPHSSSRQNLAKSQQQIYSNSNTMSKCRCEECQQAANNGPRRYLNVSSQHRSRSGNPRLRKPLPPEPSPCNDADDDDDEDVYESSCPYESCCCGSHGESDYQRLVYRSYKGQPPALRRGTVLPPKPRQPMRHESPSEEIYAAAFSGESTLLRKNKTVKNRAPDPPQRQRPISMFTISPAAEPDEKENQDSTTFLAKEKNGALVIVNRVDLEAGIITGKYVQYDVAPSLLLDQAAQQQLQQSQQQPHEIAEPMVGTATSASLLMTVDDSGTAAMMMEAMGMNYDSGVSPSATDSSTSSPPNNTNTTNSNANSNASDTSGSPPPPLLPPRHDRVIGVAASMATTRRGSAVITRKLSDQVILRRRAESDGVPTASSHGLVMVDTTLRELSVVAPPTPENHLHDNNNNNDDARHHNETNNDAGSEHHQADS